MNYEVFLIVIETVPYYITKAKKYCQDRGMDPNDIPFPKRFMTAIGLEQKRKSYHGILAVISFFSHKLLDSLKGTPMLIVVSDSEGYLLHLEGDRDFLSTVETSGIRIGSYFNEEVTGTNVISLSLQHDHPIRLIGEDHYHTFLHGLACYGTPFHYTDENTLLGTIGIMMPATFQNPLYLTMLAQFVDSIERELLLRKQNRKLNILNQILLERTKYGIVITNENGIITEFNDFAQQVSECKKETVVCKPIYQWEIVGEYFRQVIESEVMFQNKEIHFTNKYGENLICLFDAQPIYEDGRVIGAYGQFRDITERYSMEEKLRESERQALAGKIAAGIAHEIRNPLTTVRGYLQFLEKDVDEKTSSLLKDLLIPEIDRANKIITDFLRIAKPSEPTKETIKVKCFLKDYLWKFLESESLLHNVEIRMDLQPSSSDLLFLCNREELLQVFINLFQNSVQARRKDVPLMIHIETKKLESSIQFIFSNNGSGIPPSILSHIFDPFFTTKDEGSGLGLSVSRTIIENHNGVMYANSNENGAKFIIEIPYLLPNM